MAKSHGRQCKVVVATKDISPFTSAGTLTLAADVHDLTGYGATAHAKGGGLLDGKYVCSGKYDNTVSVGPRLALKPLLGTTVAIVLNVEGLGTGKPNDAFSAVVVKYEEGIPVDDYVSWVAEFEIDGAVVTTALP
jgi:hypothetical protein